MLSHIVPALDGNLQRLLRTEILVEVDMSDDILTLHPPLALQVVLVIILPVFIYHTAVWTQTFVSSISDTADNLLYLLKHLFVAQDQSCLVKQPGSLDVVTETLDIALALPLVIEEEVEMVSLLVQEFICEDVEQVANTLLQFRSLPHTIEIGVRLDDMQVRIHRTAAILVLVAQSHVGDRLPVTFQRLNISIVLTVESMVFDVMIQRDGDVECLLVTGGTSILRHTIDGESNGVGLLLGVQRIALVIHTPEDTTLFLVEEVITHVVLSSCGSLQVLRLTDDTIGSRESPQDAGIHDGSLLCLRVYLLSAIHTTIVTTILMVGHMVYPIIEDVLL